MKRRVFAGLIALVVACTVIGLYVALWIEHSSATSHLGEIDITIALGISGPIIAILFSVYSPTLTQRRTRSVTITASEEERERALLTVPDYLKDVVRNYGRLGAGPVFDACTHPRIKEEIGWTLDQVGYYPQPERAWIPAAEAGLYEQFRTENQRQPERLSKDLTKVMLVRPPSAQDKFHDEEFPLFWSKGLYSEMRFFQVRYGETVGYDDPPESVRKFRLGDNVQRRKKLLKFETDLLAGVISFPASLCINCYVVTTDERLVAFQRGPDVRYDPGKWSLTVDENVVYDEDAALSGGAFVLNCIRRGLQLELVGRETREEDFLERSRVRLLSYFVEGNVLGQDIAAYVPLKLDSKKLPEHWAKRRDSGDTMQFSLLSLDDLNWQRLRNDPQYEAGWMWKTQYLLYVLKLYLKANPLDAF